jgi:LysM repeat protein
MRVHKDMRWRSLALISLGVNLVLAVAWLFSAGHTTPGSSAAPPTTESATDQNRPHTIVRRQFFSWRELESRDYPIYIANLRDIGCPEQTIRDIIIADINALYTQKRATEMVTAESQWWRSEPDPAVVQAAAEKAKSLEDERRSLLTRLLGTNWESGDLVNLPRPSHPGVLLDGPVLGQLSAETKQAIEDVHQRSEERMQAYLDAQIRAGKTPDPAELARLRQQTRTDLARVLSPTQVEEFLLRYSQNASDLRAQFGQLKYFNASPDEFRAVFRATDQLDQQILALGDSTDPNVLRQKKSLEDQRESAVKNALGPKRYDEYRAFQDPLYRKAYAKALEAGTPEAVKTYYAIELAAAGQQDQINTDPTLTDQQRAIEMKRLELQQLTAAALANGQDIPSDPTTEQPRSPRKAHQMRPGDTLAVVSIMYNVPIEAIRDANPGVNVNALRPGDTLVIPPWPIPPTR